MALDLDNKKMNFFRNGYDLGVAFEGFSVGDGLYPAVSLTQGQQCIFNFGKTPFKYPHPDQAYKILHCFLSDAEVDNLNKLFNKYKGKFFCPLFLCLCNTVFVLKFIHSIFVIYIAVGVNLSDSGETGDLIKGPGFLEYGQELGVSEDTDPGLIILAWKLGASEQWEFTRDEFVGGWTTFGYSSFGSFFSLSHKEFHFFGFTF